MKSHLLYFPCRNAVFDWFRGETSATPRVTVELLAEQRDFESRPRNRKQRVYCYECGIREACYVTCLRRERDRDLLHLRRFPGSSRVHKPECFSYSADLVPVDADEPTKGEAKPGGDFAALWRDIGDPEYRVVSMRLRKEGQSNGGRAQRHAVSRMTVSLQRLTRELLQRSGLCTWHPRYEGTRDERVFNGRIKGALDEVENVPRGVAHELIGQLPGANFVPWSFLDHRNQMTSPGMAACAGFGFIESLGPENDHGARLLRLSNYPTRPLVMPRVVLEHEGRKDTSPLHSYLAHPTWCIFVAAVHGGAWKIHSMVLIRTSAHGLIPIESTNEDLMVERLILERRAFTRWLLPPPDCKDQKWVPDFQLLDTPLQEYIEVAGLMSYTKYAANIRRKEQQFGKRLRVWDTRDPLKKFSMPPPTESERIFLSSQRR